MPKMQPRALLMVGPTDQAFSNFYSDDAIISGSGRGRGRRGRSAMAGATSRQNVILQYFSRLFLFHFDLKCETLKQNFYFKTVLLIFLFKYASRQLFRGTVL
jgi:hypothetical protein